MPVFNVKAPDGSAHQVEAPDGMAAIATLKAQLAGAAPAVDGQTVGDGSAAVGANLIDGVPIIGPYLTAGVDRAVAGARSIGLGGQPAQSYEDELKHVQDWRKGTNDYNPKAATAGYVGGQVLGSAAAAAPVAGLLKGAAPLGQAIAGGIGGAIGTGADTAVRTDKVDDGQGGERDATLTDRASAALPAAVIGGALGTAAPLVANLVGKGAQRIANFVARNNALKGTGVSPGAARVLLRGAEADGAIGGAGEKAIQAAGPDGMLVDAGGSLQTVLDEAVANSGKGGRQAAAAVEQRAGAALGKTNQALDRALGPEEGVFTGEKAIREGTAEARGMAYKSAYSKPIDYASDYGRTLEGLVKQRVPKSAIDAANELMRTEGAQSKQIMAHVADDGTVTFERLPDVMQLDYISRGLNEVADAAHAKGKLGGTTQTGTAYGNLATAIRSTLKKAVPEYGIALDVAGDAIGQRTALRFGADLLKPSTMRDEAASIIKNYSPEDLMQARKGVRATVAETLANVKKMASDGNLDARQARVALQDLSSDAARQKIGMLMPKNEANALFRSLDQASKALELRAGIATNSKTYARGAARARVQEAAEPGILGSLGDGDIKGAGRKFTQLFTGQRGAVGQREEQLYSEITKALTEKRGADAMALIQQLQKADKTFGNADKVSGALAGSQNFGGFVGGGSSGLATSGLGAPLGLEPPRR